MSCIYRSDITADHGTQAAGRDDWKVTSHRLKRRQIRVCRDQIGFQNGRYRMIKYDSKISSNLLKADGLGTISMTGKFSELRHRTIRLFCPSKISMAPIPVA